MEFEDKAVQLVSTIENMLSNLGDTPSDERQKDEIYKRLIRVSEIIAKKEESHGSVSKNMAKLYQRISRSDTDKGIGHAFNEISYDNQFEDEKKLFKLFPKQPKTHLFIIELSKASGVEAGHDDASKHLLKMMTGKCQRTESLHGCAKNVCKHCKSSVLPQVYHMTLEMAVAELDSLVDHTRKLTEEHKLSVSDAKEVLNDIQKSLSKLEKWSKEEYSSKLWAQRMENVYLMMVHLYNDIMFRLVQTQNI